MRRFLYILLALTLSLPILTSCNIGQKSRVQTTQFYEYFDTLSTVQSYRGDTEAEFDKNCALVRATLEKYHRMFDIYYEYAGVNNLKTVNKNAGKAPVKVERELIDFLLYCKEIYALTNGETNIALGAVTKLWHDCREKAIDSPELAHLPSPTELENASLHTSIDAIVIDEALSTVYINDPYTSIDVGAIGKGYAAERAKEALIDAGVTSYVLNIGGNICCIGTKQNGEGWRTSVKEPWVAGGYSITVYLSDITCVTSGSYERYYTVNGIKYHHLIDKDTLMPSEHFASVSVFCDDSALADSLSTALFCMTYEDGLELVSSIGGIDVFWIDNNGKKYMTDGVRDLMNE